MAKIAQYFKDKAKTIKDYPKTLIKAVYGDDGKRLDNIISDITSDIDSTKAKIGTTDISQYSDGTVTGAVKSACDKADANEAAIADVNSKLGNTDISAIGDGTVTGGLNALNSNLNIKAGTFSPYSLSVNDLVVGHATYYKIGKFVYISMLVSTNKTITDNVTITGLPFVPSVDGLINLRIVGINCGATPINSDGKIYLQDHLANDLKYSTVSGRSILISGVYTTNE